MNGWGVVTIFKDTLNSTANYQAATGLDDYGDATYAAEVTVPCRLEREVNLVRTIDGELLETSYVYFLGFEPKANSKLDGRIIVALADNPALNGRTSVWEAYC